MYALSPLKHVYALLSIRSLLDTDREFDEEAVRKCAHVLLDVVVLTEHDLETQVGQPEAQSVAGAHGLLLGPRIALNTENLSKYEVRLRWHNQSHTS